MRKIIFPDGAGGISIASPASEYQERLAELAAQIVPDGMPFRILEDAAFPQNRDHRAAWMFDFDDPDADAVITIDPVKAAEADRQKLPVITRRQLRLALLRLGVTGDQVEAQIAAMPGTPIEREAAMIEWRDSSTFQRNHRLVVALGAALGLTAAQIDNAWREAATI